MVKFVDMTLVADKSLDLYCEKVFKKETIDNESSLNSGKNVFGFVKNIFSDVLERANNEYSSKYDKVLFAVPCFPITRMNRISIISRFLCNNSDFLMENGVSSSQFQESFEKFISSKCKNEYITKISDKSYILNKSGILLKDWKKSVIDKFGSSLVNSELEKPLDIVPNFIINFEFGENKFTKLSEEEKFRIDSIIDNLTNN